MLVGVTLVTEHLVLCGFSRDQTGESVAQGKELGWGVREDIWGFRISREELMYLCTKENKYRKKMKISIMFEMSIKQIRIKFGNSGKTEKSEIWLCFMI